MQRKIYNTAAETLITILLKIYRIGFYFSIENSNKQNIWDICIYIIIFLTS